MVNQATTSSTHFSNMQLFVDDAHPFAEKGENRTHREKHELLEVSYDGYTMNQPTRRAYSFYGRITDKGFYGTMYRVDQRVSSSSW